MTIYIDAREDTPVIRAYRQVNRNIKIVNLPSGDLSQGDYGLEHKSLKDFRESVYSGHIFDQIDIMQTHFLRSAIIVDNSYSRTVNSSAIEAAVASCFTRGCPVLFYDSLPNMVRGSLSLLEKLNDNKDRSWNSSINPKKYKDYQLNVITGLPQIEQIKGDALLNHFRTISSISSASIEDLTKVPGIGEKTATQIYKTLHTPRW